MSVRDVGAASGAAPRTSMRSPSRLTSTPTSLEDVEERAEVLAGAPRSVTSPPVTAAATTNVPASMRSAMTRCSAPRRRRRPSTSIVSGAVRSTSAPISWRKRDEVVDLRLLGGRPDGRVAVGQRRREDRVLGAHHGHVREVDVGAAQPAGRPGEVVAVAVLDVGAQGAHRVDVQVDRPPADAVAAGVADDDAAEARQQRARAG